jgi:AcrR family transcriptional regulator
MIRVNKPNETSKKPSSKRPQEIIRSALNLFVKHGYETTSMQDIADACKMSKGNFYNYFKAKKDLVEAIIDLANNCYLRNTENEINKVKLIGAKEALKRQIKLYLRTVDNNKDAYIFLNHVVFNLEKNDRQPIYQTAAAVAHSFERILAAGVKNGAFRRMNVKMVSLNITALCTGWAYYRWKLREVCTLEQFEKEMIVLTLNGLRQV